MTEAEQKLRDLIAKVAEEAGARNYSEMARAILEAGYIKAETLADLKARARKRPDLVFTDE